MGRTDDQFSCGGENINPKEVELLLVQHPDVIDAVVAPIAHEVKGLSPAALVTVRAQPGPGEEAIKRFTIENGPAYAHPRRVFVVNQMPFNGAPVQGVTTILPKKPRSSRSVSASPSFWSGNLWLITGAISPDAA